MRRRYVASTLLRRHLPAGNLPSPPPPWPPNILNLPTPMRKNLGFLVFNSISAGRYVAGDNIVIRPVLSSFAPTPSLYPHPLLNPPPCKTRIQLKISRRCFFFFFFYIYIYIYIYNGHSSKFPDIKRVFWSLSGLSAGFLISSAWCESRWKQKPLPS